jgi:hypothetical protein
MDETVGAELVGKFLDLRLGALIAPDQRGPDDLIVRIQQDGSMHLAGKADAGNLVFTSFHPGESATHGQAAGSPPIARILFRPTWLGRSEGGVLFGARGDYPALFIHEESAGSASTDIDPEELDNVLRTAQVTRSGEARRG